MDNTEERTPESEVRILKYKDDPFVYFSTNMTEGELMSFLLLSVGRFVKDYLRRNNVEL